MSRPFSSLRSLPAMVLGVALLVPRVADAQAKACARNATGTFTVNGIVASGATLGACVANANWSRVAPLALTPGASTANGLATGTVSFTYFSGHLYLGFTVAQDGDLNVLDAVVVVVDRNNNGWDDGDFFLRIRPDTTGWGATNPRVSPTGGTDCNKPTIVEYYRYSVADGGFIIDEIAGVASAVVAKIAYDYETATDGETNLWNLEVDLPTAAVSKEGHSYFGITTADFSMGAYIFADLGANQFGQVGMVLRWPEGVGDRQISQWDLNAPALNAANLADVTANSVCFNVTFAGVGTPWEINGGAAADGNSLVNPVNQSNSFRVTYEYDGPGDSPTAGANAGTVTLQLIPSISTNWTPTEAWVQSHAVTLANYNQTYSESFTAPAGSFRADAVFLCAKPKLEGFTRDDYVVFGPSYGENELHINHNYFHTSADTQVIALSADAVPNLGAGQSARILMFLGNTNDPSATKVAQGPADERTGALFLVVAAGFFGVAAARRRRRGLMVLLALVGIAFVGAGCDRIQLGGGRIGTERWQLLNAGELGITPLRNEPGWYQVSVKKGEVKRMRIAFTDRPLPYRTSTQQLVMALDSATGRPQATTIGVKTGQVVTVLALGDIDPDGPDGPLSATSASGTFRRDAATPTLAVTTTAPRYFLNNPHYTPSQWVGTVIGSFDGFKTTFVVGTNASIAVPRGAERLSLAVNGTATDYGRATGAFTIKWIVTEAPRVPTAVPVGFDTPFDSPFRLDPWRVLAATHVYTFYEAPIVNPQTHQTVTARVPYGDVHMSVYESHVQ